MIIYLTLISVLLSTKNYSLIYIEHKIERTKEQSILFITELMNNYFFREIFDFGNSIEALPTYI